MSGLTAEQERRVLRCPECDHPQLNHGATGCGVGWPNSDDACRCPFGNRMLPTIAALIAEAVEQARAEVAAEIERVVLPLCDTSQYEGGYDCCGCETYGDIAAHAARIARGEVTP